MSTRSFVEFDAEFPDDAEWDAAGNLVTPGGRIVISWICRSLQASGFECGEVTQRSFYGWQFDVRVRGTVFQVVLQGGPNWLLICEAAAPLWRRLFRRAEMASQEKVLSTVNSVLKNDPRASNARWFSREEYEAGKREQRRPGR